MNRWLWVLLVLLVGCLAVCHAHALTVTTPGQVVTGSVAGDLVIRAHGVKVRNATISGSLFMEAANDVLVRDSYVGGKQFGINAVDLGSSKRDSVINVAMPNLGKGMTSGNISRVWNAESTYFERFRRDITVDVGTTNNIRVDWHLDHRLSKFIGCKTTYTTKSNGHDQLVRWRADPNEGLTKGCFGNYFESDTALATGVGTWRVLMSSCSSCDGSLVGGVGHWNMTMDHVLWDFSGIFSCRVYWQGGGTDVTIRTSTIRASGPAIEMFDTHRVSITDCTLATSVASGQAVRFTNEWPQTPGGNQPGDLEFCRNNVVGTFFSDAKAMTDVMGLNCGAPVPPPTPTPTPTPPKPDTVFVTSGGKVVVITP